MARSPGTSCACGQRGRSGTSSSSLLCTTSNTRTLFKRCFACFSTAPPARRGAEGRLRRSFSRVLRLRFRPVCRADRIHTPPHADRTDYARLHDGTTTRIYSCQEGCLRKPLLRVPIRFFSRAEPRPRSRQSPSTMPSDRTVTHRPPGVSSRVGCQAPRRLVRFTSGSSFRNSPLYSRLS
jgi:hypothetical protein